MKRRVVIDVLFRALLCLVCIKVFELVTLIETENTLPIIGIDYKEAASCLIVFFDEPRFEIADNLLAYMIITPLIFCVYTKAANKYCWIGAQMFLPGNFSLDFVGGTFGDKRGLDAVIGNSEKGNNLSCLTVIIDKTIGLAKTGFSIQNCFVMKKVFQITISTYKRETGKFFCESGKLTTPEKVERGCYHSLFRMFDDDVTRTFHHLADGLFQLLRYCGLYTLPLISFRQCIETVGCYPCEHGNGLNSYGHNILMF